MNHMRKISVVVLGLLTAGSVHAQLTILTDNQSVNVSGWVEDAGGNVTQSYSQSQTQANSFASFTSSVGANVSGPFCNNTIFSGSSAAQNSFASSTQLSYSGSVGAFQSYPAPAGHLYAEASSLFTVSFSVSSATQFSLTDNQHNWDFADTGESLTLSSSSHGVIVTGPQLNPVGDGLDQYSGILEPDQIYTLQVSLTTQDSSQPNVSQAFEVALNMPEISPVPEPSPGLLLGMGSVIAGLVVLRRKRPAPAKNNAQ